MAKIKPARRTPRGAPPAKQSGVSCLILVIGGMALIMLFLYLVMKYANG